MEEQFFANNYTRITHYQAGVRGRRARDGCICVPKALYLSGRPVGTNNTFLKIGMSALHRTNLITA